MKRGDAAESRWSCVQQRGSKFTETDDAKALGQSYLLTLPADKTDAFALAQLRLNWESLAANWQGKASLYSSRDLKYWRSVQEDAPLMDLTRDSDRLKMDTISADLTLSADGNRYLLLILDAQSKAPALNSVTALAERREPESTRIELDAQADRVSDEEAVWRWARPQPLTSLRISLAGEGVLPVELAWRSGENEPWQPLTKTVLYQLDGKRSDDIPLSGQTVEAVRMKTINARLSASLPAISGARDKYQLVFNTQGKGLICWPGETGRRKRQMSPDMLIPPSLRKTQSVNDLLWRSRKKTSCWAAKRG